MSRRKFNELAQHLQDIMMESLPKMVDECIKKILQPQVALHLAQGIRLEREKSQAEVAKMIADAIQQESENFQSKISLQVNDAITNHIPRKLIHQLGLQQDDLPFWLTLKYKFKRFHMAATPCRPSVVRPRDQDDPHEDAHPKGENSEKMQKTSKHGTFVLGESSSGQDYESEPGPSTSVSQELIDEMSQIIDEAKLRKVINEMLRQQCTLGDEHQHYIDQM
ncbi:hypothetical protein Tco_1171447 [Tanacetum coccineum]